MGEDTKLKYKTDKQGYTINKFAWSVAPNCKLIALNKMTGEATALDPGVHFLAPGLVVGKEYDVSDKNDCFNDIVCKTADGHEVRVDIDIVTNISDVLKFEFASSNPDELIIARLESLMRRFIEDKTYDTLNKITLDIKDPKNAWIKQDLNKFAKEYGLQVKQILLKKVKLPKELEDDYQKKIAQEKENERKLAEAEGNLKVAGVNAKIKKIDKKTDNEMDVDYVLKLQKAGLEPQMIADIMRFKALASASNPNTKNVNVYNVDGGFNSNSFEQETGGKTR